MITFVLLTVLFVILMVLAVVLVTALSTVVSGFLFIILDIIIGISPLIIICAIIKKIKKKSCLGLLSFSSQKLQRV